MFSKEHKYFYLITAVTWLLLSVIMSIQLFSRWQASSLNYSFFTALAVELFYSFLLVLFTPPVLWLSGKFFLEKKKWFTGALIHLLLAIIVAVVSLTGRRLLLGFVAAEAHPLSGKVLFNSVYYGLDYGIMGYLLLAFFCYSYRFYLKFRERDLQAVSLQTELANAQLQVLKSQLQPHFLFNTLNSISALIRKQDNSAAIKMISGLGTFLRYSLEKINIQEIALKEELELLDMYLDIQKQRFSDRLNVKKNIDPETQNASFPNLLLQPLIENAIQHGISQNQNSGLIKIDSIKENGTLKMKIFNDGSALSEDYLNGIGLSNTKTRLRKLYGEDQSFRIFNVDGGVQAEISIPFRIIQ